MPSPLYLAAGSVAGTCRACKHSLVEDTGHLKRLSSRTRSLSISLTTVSYMTWRGKLCRAAPVRSLSKVSLSLMLP